MDSVPINIDSKKNGATILIVEDDFFNAEYLKELLFKTEHKVFYAKSGEEALEYVQKENIELILMDIKLPGISGLEATKLIKISNPEIKIIAQTAFASSSDKTNALEAGCDSYISKPIFKNLLFEIIHDLLNNK